MRVALLSCQGMRPAGTPSSSAVVVCVRMAVLCGLFGACDSAVKAKHVAQAAPNAAATALEHEPIGYPSGDWWQSGGLNSLLLNASQIVISYAGAQTNGAPVPFASVARSKQEALRVARSLRAELRADPAKFAQLARKHSDEPVSAAMGGALGNFFALAMPREIVDALGQINTGELSRIVETEQGYHLLLRQPAVTAGTLALAHIVIKHVDATGFRRGDRPFPDHTREEARALARDIAAQAAREPESFAALVRQHSEAEDASRDGDLGLWPRSEPLEAEFLLFEVAARLAIGAVSGVIETASGFHIVKRSTVQDRQRFAMSAITILHGESQFQKTNAIASRTKAEAARRARKLLAELSARPQRFAQRKREQCEVAFCDGVYAFDEGRGPPAVERVLRSLALGQLAQEPVDTPFGLVVLRREDPALAPAVAQVQPRTEFGAPEPEIAQSSARDAKRSQTPAEAQEAPEQFVDSLRQFERYAFGKMRLSATERSGVTAILDEFARAVIAGTDRDLGADAQHADERLTQLLGASKHEELTRHRLAFFSEAAQ